VKIKSLLSVYTLKPGIRFNPTPRRTPLNKFIVSSNVRLRAYLSSP